MSNPSDTNFLDSGLYTNDDSAMTVQAGKSSEGSQKTSVGGMSDHSGHVD